MHFEFLTKDLLEMSYLKAYILLSFLAKLVPPGLGTNLLTSSVS